MPVSHSVNTRLIPTQRLPTTYTAVRESQLTLLLVQLAFKTKKKQNNKNNFVFVFQTHSQCLKVVGALSPVNRKGLYQGWREKSRRKKERTRKEEEEIYKCKVRTKQYRNLSSGFNFRLSDTTVTLKCAKGQSKCYQCVELGGGHQHATFKGYWNNLRERAIGISCSFFLFFFPRDPKMRR